MGGLFIVVGAVLGFWDLFSIQPRWWGPYAWLLVLLGIMLAQLGI